MSDAFISYSRKDSEFVQRLSTAFTNANRVVWVDWQNIPRGEDWWREIQSGIEQADAFICVVGEAWLTSEICHNELLYARQQNKRILPLIRQQIRDEVEKRVKGTWMDLSWEQTARDNWDVIRHLNWIFFDEDKKFDAEFTSLVKALEEDQPYIKAHTRYQNRALEWERSGQNPSFLLSGDDLTFAEKWLANSSGKQPQPTIEHQAYISASIATDNTRKAQETARERRIIQFRRTSKVLTVILILVVSAIFELKQNIDDAKLQQDIANMVIDASFDVISGNLTAADSIANTLVERYPNRAFAYANSGLIHLNTNQLDEAIADFTKAIELEKQFTGAYYNRGLAYDRKDQVEQAINDYSQAIHLDSQYYKAYINRGNDYGKQEKFVLAIDDFTQAIQLYPKDAGAYYNRGVAYTKMQNLDNAIADFDQGINLDPQFIDLYAGRGYVYYLQGRYVEALTDWDTYKNLGGKRSSNFQEYRSEIEATLTAIPISLTLTPTPS